MIRIVRCICCSSLHPTIAAQQHFVLLKVAEMHILLSEVEVDWQVDDVYSSLSID